MATSTAGHKRKFLLQGICLLLLWQASFSGAFAQQTDLRFTHISLRQGLSQSTVFSIVQDTIGFMWFATLDGLNKYDGSNFTVYRPDPPDSTSLPEPGIRKLYHDRAGNLWIITIGGKLSRYLPAKDCFRQYPLSGDSAVAGRPYRAIDLAEEASGNLWLALSSGSLYQYDRRAGTFVPRFPAPRGSDIPGKLHLQRLYIDHNDVFWLGAWEGLIRFHPRTGQLLRYRNSPDNELSLSGNIVFDMAEDAQGRLWVGAANGGVTVLDSNRRIAAVYQHDPHKPGSLSSNRVMRVFTDSRQGVWIGTVDAGLNLFDPQTGSFVHYRHDSAQPSSLGSGAVMSIYEDDSGVLWFGSSGSGVNRYDRRSRRFRRIAHNSNDPGSLSANPVLSILEDRRGGLWVGTDGGGLNYRPPGEQRFEHLLTQLGNIGSNSVTALYQDRRGVIWIGADPGSQNPAGAVFRYNLQTHSLASFTGISPAVGGVTIVF